MKKKLHIVFLDFDDIKNPLLAAGQARATVDVGKRLVARGHKVTIISSRYPGYEDRKENGMYYKHIGLGSKNIRLNNFAYIFAVPFIVRKLKADVIIECFTAPVSTMFSPLFTRIPVIGLSTSFEAERFSDLYHFPFHKIEQFGLQFYKYFIALTPFFEEKMRNGNPDVVSTVIPEGVEKEFFAIRRKVPKHILFLGRFDIGQKGIDLLLAAYAKIATQVKYPLVIVGKGPDEQKIRDLIAKYQLERYVSLKGPAYGAEKAKYLSESLFVALPSRNETFSCFALEALAAGAPLATFDIPGLAWTDDEVAQKAKPFDVADYARVLKHMANKSQMEKLSKKAREYAKNFSWDDVAKDFETFMNEVLMIEDRKKFLRFTVAYEK